MGVTPAATPSARDPPSAGGGARFLADPAEPPRDSSSAARRPRALVGKWFHRGNASPIERVTRRPTRSASVKSVLRPTPVARQQDRRAADTLNRADPLGGARRMARRATGAPAREATG